MSIAEIEAAIENHGRHNVELSPNGNVVIHTNRDEAMSQIPPKNAASHEPQPMKWMSLQEFQALGFLQELNRCFLHPLGLAMAVANDGENVTFAGIWDCRDDPEGIIYGPEDVKAPEFAQKAAHVSQLRESKFSTRFLLCGFGEDGAIQPIPTDN